MSTLTAAPQALAAPMTMRVGNRFYPVASLVEASRMFCAARDKSGLGGSQIQTPLLYEGERLVGYVSYNGRVWAGRPQDWQPGAKPLCEAVS